MKRKTLTKGDVGRTPLAFIVQETCAHTFSKTSECAGNSVEIERL